MKSFSDKTIGNSVCADALVLMTAHRKFREIELSRVKERMRTPIMIDGRRVFERDDVNRLGFVYRGVGRG